MFKNMTLYRLLPGADLSRLENQLDRLPFVECGPMDRKSAGFGITESGGRLNRVGNDYFLRLDIEERPVSARAVDLQLRKHCEAFQTLNGYQAGRKQRREMKERIVDAALPSTLPVRRSTWVWIDPVNGYFAIDTASPSRAEEVTDALRKCMDDFPLALFDLKNASSSAMVGMLYNAEAEFCGFAVDDYCELAGAGDDAARIRYKNFSLDSQQILDHLEAGKHVEALALTYRERVSFTLTEGMALKGIVYLDVSREGDAAPTDKDAELAIMAGEFRALIPDLLRLHGGER